MNKKKVFNEWEEKYIREKLDLLQHQVLLRAKRLITKYHNDPKGG
jgi:hypothetical protein